MILRTIISALLLVSSLFAAADGVGTWRNYLSYYTPTEIEQGSGNIIFVLASNGLYSYNTNDQSLQTFDKVNALSDCTISHIKWNPTAKRLVIVYDNENIDIMDINGNVVNIPDYYSKSMIEDKTVNDIYIYGKHAYLSTGFGIVKLNVADEEISDTYNLGFKVNHCYIENDKIYASSQERGLYSATLTANLLDKNNWKRVGNYTAKTNTIDPELLAIAQTLNPGGPKYNYFWFMRFANNRLYTCGGGYQDIFETNRPGTVQVMKDGEWEIYEDNLSEKTGVRYVDINSLDIDPKDNNHVFAGGRTGLYEFQNGKLIKQYNNENSPLESAVMSNSKNYDVVDGIKFDSDGNLWVLNTRAITQSILKLENGEWQSIKKSELMKYVGEGGLTRSLSTMQKTMFDSRGLMWFVNNSYLIPSLYCYQPSTNAMISYTTFTNQDGTNITPDNGVSCIAEDRNGNLWIGTSVGPIVLEAQDVANPANEVLFTQVKVPRNDGTNFADYLLANVSISCLTIDGGNRKWFGTKGDGIYLISDDNIQQLQHFTTENSPLLSNNIESIAINDATGEVFFGTDKGLCSYMSDATKPAETMDKDNVYAYPNPVRPDYTGLITVVGLTINADVKIVTSSGALVAEGRSNGGTFTWDGNDLSGKRVASGVYMVETATENGEKGTVCKIAIVN